MCTIQKLHNWSNTQVDNAQDINLGMPMYNLIKLKTLETSFRYYRDELDLNNDDAIVDCWQGHYWFN